jgi:hypothetical protein
MGDAMFCDGPEDLIQSMETAQNRAGVRTRLNPAQRDACTKAFNGAVASRFGTGGMIYATGLCDYFRANKAILYQLAAELAHEDDAEASSSEVSAIFEDFEARRQIATETKEQEEAMLEDLMAVADKMSMNAPSVASGSLREDF